MAKQGHGKKHHLSGHGHVHHEGGEAVMGGSKGMSPRKAMASGEDGGGNFGCCSYQEDHGGPPETHPDAVARTGAKGAMEDGERGIGGAIHHHEHMHPAQAAPDHGHTHPGGHMRHHGHGGHAVKI